MPTRRGAIVETIDEVVYHIKKPSVFIFTGNLSIYNQKTDSNLLIWPKIFNENIYRFIAYDEDEMYAITVNEKYEISEDPNIIGVKTDVHQEQMDILLNLAKNYWNLDE